MPIMATCTHRPPRRFAVSNTIPVTRSRPTRRRRHAAAPVIVATLLACLTAAGARADGRCFTGDLDQTYSFIRGNGDGKEYMLGVDKLLTSVLMRFFPDGHVCGIGYGDSVRIEGANFADSQI